MFCRTVAALAVCLLTGLPVLAAEESDLGITLDTTVVSRYMWRGFDVLGDKAAFQPSVNWDVPGTGLSLNVWGSFGLGNNCDDLNELDYSAAYGYSFFAEERYQVDATLTYIYYHYPRLDLSNVQEVDLGFEMPNLIPVGDSNLVPSYTAAKVWADHSDTPGVAGWFHIFGLAYDLSVSCPIRDGVKQPIELTAEVVYNDGAFGVDEDWSHVQFGLALPVELGMFTLTPAVTCQRTFEETVNPERNEVWGSLGLSCEF